MTLKNFHYLYKITHIKSKKIYYGIHSTNDMNDRYFANGVYESSASNKNDWVKMNHGHAKLTHMQNALAKYGRKAFTREIIETFKDRKSALKAEKRLVTKNFIERKDNFNNRTGGEGSLEFSEKVRKKISDNNPMKNPEIAAKVGKHSKKWWTQKRKSEFSKNNPMKNPEIVAKMSGKNSAWFGKKHTEDAKKKISKANTGTIRTKKQIESQRKKIKEYWSDSERVAKRKNVLGIKKPKSFGKKLSQNWKELIEIKDNSTGKIYNSVKEVQELLASEGMQRSLSTISAYIRGKKGKRSGLDKRFIYLKNPKNKTK